MGHLVFSKLALRASPCAFSWFGSPLLDQEISQYLVCRGCRYTQTLEVVSGRGCEDCRLGWLSQVVLVQPQRAQPEGSPSRFPNAASA
jgi:hypothetical protein